MRLERVDFGGELLHEVDGGAVHVGVDGIEAQAVEVVIAEPHEGVVAEEAADFEAAAVFEIDGVAPRRVVCGGEVGAEFREVVAGGAEVVVDDVEENGEPVGVAGIDEALEGIGPAVGFVRGEEIDAVVAPALDSGKGIDGHELDVGDAEVAERIELRLRGVECAFGREGADMELIEMALRKAEALATRRRSRQKAA